MSWLNRRALYALGAVTLIGSALAIAADEPGPASKVEVSTIGSGPAGLTAAEIEKLLELELVRITATAPPIAGPAPELAAKKAPEVSTIVVGVPGLTAQELAKLQGAAPPAAPAAATAQPAPAATDEQE